VSSVDLSLYTGGSFEYLRGEPRGVSYIRSRKNTWKEGVLKLVLYSKHRKISSKNKRRGRGKIAGFFARRFGRRNKGQLAVWFDVIDKLEGF